MIERKSTLIKYIIVCFLVFIIVANSGYLLQVSSGTFSTFTHILTMLFGVILFLDYVVLKKNVIRANGMQIYFWIFTLLSVMAMLANWEVSWLYLNTLAVAFIALYIVEKFDPQIVVETFVNVMFLIAVISLIFILWIYIKGIPPSFSMVSTTTTENECYNYFVFFYPKLWESSLARNRGVFWEPGLYASYLIIALILDICFNKKKSKLKELVLATTVITTYSTAGIILLFLVGILFVDMNVPKKNIRVIWMVILGSIALFLIFNIDNIIYILIGISPDVFSKLLGEEQTTVTRLGAPMLNFKIFMENPVFGAGFSGATNLFVQNQVQYKADSQTSTSLYMMASLGVGGILYTYWWVKGILKMRGVSIISRIIILVIVLSILNKEPHSVLLATWMIMFLFTAMTKEQISEV
jgi:hypothetical protein